MNRDWAKDMRVVRAARRLEIAAVVYAATVERVGVASAISTGRRLRRTALDYARIAEAVKNGWVS